MPENQVEKSWADYCQSEIAKLKPILHNLGFFLAEEQIHIGGERYAFFSTKKLVLVGQQIKDNLKVIIKVASDAKGINEINHERNCRHILEKVKFAQQVFFFPPEILFTEKEGRTILITTFIEQETTFLNRPQEEQFFLSLKGLEAQEGVQATTYEHTQVIRKTFGLWRSDDYLRKFFEYWTDISKACPEQGELADVLARADKFLAQNVKGLDLYADFLTHWDFVPHNFRIKNNNIYLLDHSSFRFGNKHEGWARFINFMVLYNPQLATNLIAYIKLNREPAELMSLRLMRIFRLGDIMQHYIKTIPRASADLKILNQERVNFWAKVLESVLDDKELDLKVVEEYKKKRDILRTPEEKKRQEKLH